MQLKDLNELFRVLSENDMVNTLRSYRLLDIKGRNVIKTEQKILKSCIFKDLHLVNGNSEPNNNP